VNDSDRAAIWPGGVRGDLPERLWDPGELSVSAERAEPDLSWSLISLAFIRGALRRMAWLWCLTPILGLVIGTGLYLKYPPAYHATATVLLADNPSQDPSVEVLTDQSLAESEPVAATVVHELGLHQSAASFQTTYTVTVVTDTVLTFNVGAPSSADAVQRASAVANAFLGYRAAYERTQYQQLVATLNEQSGPAERSAGGIDAKISRLPTQLTSDQKVTYDGLLRQLNTQQLIINYVTNTEAAAKTDLQTMVSSRYSYVLDPATPIKHSKLKGLGLYVAGGVLGGLAIGMAIVIIWASLSSRLRRRDEVAAALGAPVKLSVGSLRQARRLPVPPRRTSNRDLDMRRVVAYLRAAVPGGARGAVSLAVVAVDDPQTVARAVASLADACVGEGRRLVVADLVSGAPLARLLGAGDPGVRAVSRNGVRLMVAVPDRDDVAPVGPLRAGRATSTPILPDEALVTAAESADLLLTLVTLDPALGGDHLATWATNAVAVVTAGQSSTERVHSVGEMIRLGGTRLDSVVLIGADKNDESLGVVESAVQSALI
jgi:capsular polysaccharide biosynthesis protein